MMKNNNLPKGWEIEPFDKCIEKEASSNKLKIPQSKFLDKGKYAIIDQSMEYIAGYTNDSTKIYKDDLPIIIFGDHTRIFKFIDFPFALGADGTKILVPRKDMLNPKYFYFFLKGLRLENHGYSRHYKFLKEKQIILPPLPTQKKIASILEKAERLKEWRKEADRLTDEFLKSTFLEMFGDPVKNPKGWEIVKFGNLWYHYSHGYPGRNNLGNPLGTLILRIRNVLKDKVVYDKLDREEIALKYIQRYALERGDLLLVRVNGSPEEIGRSVIFQGFDEVVIHDDNIIRIVLDSSTVLPEYIQELLKSRYIRSKIAKTCKTTAGQYLLSKMKLHEIDMPCPPLKFQRRFVNIIKNVETIQQSQIQSQQQIDNLFNSLMQKAFKGELAC